MKETHSLEAFKRFEYSAALQVPLDVLRNGSEVAKQGVLPLQISDSRGQIPVLTHGDPVDSRGIAVVANCGALTYNSKAFINPGLDPYLAEVIAYDQVAYAPRMLTYTKEGDNFVYESSNPLLSEAVLHQIRNSYEQIGIGLTDKFIAVDGINDWIRDQKGRVPIAANAFDPMLLASFGRTPKESDYLFQHGLVNAAAYTKKGVTDLWKEKGVPVPDTKYYDLARVSDAASAVEKDFGEHERIVVSTSDGAGGDGVAFMNHTETRAVFDTRFKGKEVQVQGLLPLESSPCLIANITPDGVKPLLLSQQRFSTPGAHGGNVWDANVHGVLDALPQDFVQTNQRSLQALSESGVFGQVNVDSLVVTSPRKTLMREANIRPAGSSVILRMKEGLINSEKISRIHTSAGIKIEPKVLLDPAFLDHLNTFSTGSLRAVLYGYDIQASKASIAFLAAGARAEDLDIFEQMTTAMLCKKLVE